MRPLRCPTSHFDASFRVFPKKMIKLASHRSIMLKML